MDLMKGEYVNRGEGASNKEWKGVATEAVKPSTVKLGEIDVRGEIDRPTPTPGVISCHV